MMNLIADITARGFGGYHAVLLAARAAGVRRVVATPQPLRRLLVTKMNLTGS